MDKARLAAALLTLVSASCAKDVRGDDAEQVFSQYIRAWKNNDTATVWRLMSSRLKNGNNNDKAYFEKFVTDHGFRPVGYQVISVNREGDAVEIEANVEYSGRSNENLGGERQVCRMILETGSWRFDDCTLPGKG